MSRNNPDSLSEQILAEVTLEASIALGRMVLDKSGVDSSGWDDADLDELVEQMLRTLQSLIVDPRPPRTDSELRRYLHRWVAPACNPLR